MILQLALLGVAAVVAGSVVVYALRTGIAPTPASGRARRVILDLLPDEVDGLVLELGCGWGGLACALGRRFPRARIRAFELSPLPWLVSRVRARLAGLANLEVRRRDFFRGSFADADVVVAYLFTGAMARLAPRLAAELPPGAIVVSFAFHLPGWIPDREVEVPGVWRGRVYQYVVGDSASRE